MFLEFSDTVLNLQKTHNYSIIKEDLIVELILSLWGLRKVGPVVEVNSDFSDFTHTRQKVGLYCAMDYDHLYF